MNYLQFLLFAIYMFSVLLLGLNFYNYLDREGKNHINDWIYIGESFLIGTIILIGSMVSLSLIGLYKAPYLWSLVMLNYGFLIKKGIRSSLCKCFIRKTLPTLPVIIFFGLLFIFMYRNCFFLVDVDSHSTYLFAQRLWLQAGTSLVGDVARDVRVFAPHFNAVPYSLGLSIFGLDTLFPQLVVASWTVIGLILVFGYTSYHFNPWYGLATVMLVLFNDHIFYSGANQCCIINSDLVCLLFASAYNFWEGRNKDSLFRFFLALVFLSQLMANKYQMFYIAVFLLFTGLLIQPNPIQSFYKLYMNKRYRFSLLVAILLMALWYLKNYLVTGTPTFPILAGELSIFNWNTQMAEIFNKAFAGGLTFMQIMKFLNYLFIWPGIDSAKFIIMVISFLPVILMTLCRSKIENEQLIEFGYWLAIPVLLVIGLCLVSFVDPRHYRYGIAIFSFSTIFALDFIFRNVFNLRSRFVIGGVLIIFSLMNCKIIFAQGGGPQRPTFSDNFKVISNRLHFDDVVDRYFPANRVVWKEYELNHEKIAGGAWDTGVGGVTHLSSFLLPIRPQVGLWHTTVVKWDSYNKAELIVKDLNEYGIKWIMRVEEGELKFLTPESYAREAISYDRFPRMKFYNYGFPEELSHAEY